MTGLETIVAESIIKAISTRLGFLQNVGVDCLTLSRSAGTLSEGENQHIHLATQVDSGLTEVLYILDKLSIQGQEYC